MLLSIGLTGPGGGPEKACNKLELSSLFHSEEKIVSCSVRGPINEVRA